MDQQLYVQGFIPVMQAYLAHTVNLSPTDVGTGQGIVLVEDVPALWDLAKRGLPCDLNDLAAASATVRAVAEQVGGFDILIKNAALIINRPYDAFTLVEHEDQILVNSAAAFALTAVCAVHMKAQGWGRVINFISVTLKGILDG